MSESFLHYIWQFQYFNKGNLLTTEGESVEIFNQGMLNKHAGPDFFNARIKIDQMEWVGNVEIHINASSWLDHHHDRDDAYENVILHIVWKNDKPVRRKDGSLLPTLELKNRVSEELILKYTKLINSPEAIPCSARFNSVNDLVKVSMLDKSLLQRLESKALIVTQILNANNLDWEETCYQLLARNFGFKVNADPFFQLAKSVPYKVLLKHADKLLQVEAILFGQAGFLDGEQSDEYYRLLQREYSILSNKFTLLDKKINRSQWRFLRLRPSNFPTIRLAQLSALLAEKKNIFSTIKEAATYQDLKKVFGVKQSYYWQHHFQFLKESKEMISGLGDMSIENIIINTVCPLLVAYGKAKDEQEWIDKAVSILQQIPAESNSIVKKWTSLDQSAKTAFDSQALIELYNNLCLKKRCLDCNIGVSILNPVQA